MKNRSSCARWFVDQTNGDLVKEREHFYRHSWDFFIPNARILGETVEKGNYSWNFELEVPGNWSESVEGSSDTYIVYRLKATIDRGLLLPKIVIRKHLRIIRTLDPSSLELCQPAVQSPIMQSCLVILLIYFSRWNLSGRKRRNFP